MNMYVSAVFLLWYGMQVYWNGSRGSMLQIKNTIFQTECSWAKFISGSDFANKYVCSFVIGYCMRKHHLDTQPDDFLQSLPAVHLCLEHFSLSLAVRTMQPLHHGHCVWFYLHNISHAKSAIKVIMKSLHWEDVQTVLFHSNLFRSPSFNVKTFKFNDVQ